MEIRLPIVNQMTMEMIIVTMMAVMVAMMMMMMMAVMVKVMTLQSLTGVENVFAIHV